MQRVTFFGGKGGVGKTTCAAAAAARAATEGARVLVVSTDPAHSLADALATKLGREPSPVPGTTRLFAAQLDADRALTRWLRDNEDAFKTIAERGTYLDTEDVERLFALSLPGVDELVGLLELTRLASSDDFDHVVVDTAPTGHTLRLLEMPETLRRFSEVLDDMHAKHRFLAQSLGGRWRADFADEAIARIEADAKALRELVTDRGRCSFTWVTLPETMSIAESEDGIAAIEALGVDVATVVVNRVWPAPDRPCDACSPRVAAERPSLDRLRRGFGAKRLLEAPAALVEPRGVDTLVAFARTVRPLTVRAAPPASPRARRLSARRTKPALDLLALASLRVVFVGGKGGVGKTSVASALAIAMAEDRPRQRVLLLSTDPAHSLGDALDSDAGDEPATAPGAPANLFVREVDAKATFEVEKARYRASIDELFASIFRGNMDASFDRAVLEDLLELAPPGLDELFALLGMLDALFLEGGYDLLVVDTAPTGHTLRLLALPAAALEWVHAIMSIILKYRKVVGLGELAVDLTNLAKRLRAFIALLADPAQTAFLAVSRPAALPRIETERLLAALGKLRIPVAAVVANVVTDTPGCSRCEAAIVAEAPELALLAKAAKRAKAELVSAPAAYPSPRGPAALSSWCATWTAGMIAADRRR